MTRFRIEFDGHVAASQDEVDAALDLVTKRLTDLWVGDPSASATVTAIELRIAFVLEAADPRHALDGGHDLLGHVTADTGLTGVTWTAARAEIDPNA
jgi:hypothetical protein